MTNETAKTIGTIIGRFLSLCIDLGAAVALGHHFHSGAVGFVTFLVLGSLSAANHRLIDLKEKI